jgi:hypothetical protein
VIETHAVPALRRRVSLTARHAQRPTRSSEIPFAWRRRSNATLSSVAAPSAMGSAS